MDADQILEYVEDRIFELGEKIRKGGHDLTLMVLVAQQAELERLRARILGRV